MKRTLISLSLITSMWVLYKKDYLDAFVPFIATLIKKRNIKLIKEDNIDKICEMFFDEFGLQIPVHPMISIINKCKKRKLLRKISGEFKPNNALVLKLDFSKQESETIRKHNIIIRDYIGFAKEKYGIQVNETEAINIILNFLKNNDIEILFASNSNSILPNIHLSKKYKKYSYILYKYITLLYEKKLDHFNYLCNIALGHIVSSTILLDNYEFQNDTVKNCNIYIDSPLLLQLLGVTGKNKKAAINYLLKVLLNNGAKLKIFHHNYQETIENLENALTWLDSPSYDPTMASKTVLFFRHEGYTKSEVERIINKLDDTIKEFKITVEDIPEFQPKKDFQINEVKLEELIESAYRKFNTKFDKQKYGIRIKRDIDSISAIYRLRERNKPRYLRQAKHIMMTDNRGLVCANKEYNKSERISEREMFACLTEVFIGTIVWLHSPRETKKEYRQKFLADCYSSINPDPMLEKRLLEEAKRLKESNNIGENEFLLLSTSYLTRNLLSEKTIGDPDNFNSKTAQEILEDLKKEYQKDLLEGLKIKNDKLSQLTDERDYYRDSFEKTLHKRAKRFSKFITSLLIFFIFAGIVSPVFLMITSNPFWIGISIVFGGVTTYFSFIKKLGLKDIVNFLYKSHLKRLKKRY